MTYDKVQDCLPKFSCLDCDYVTSRKSQYSRHLLTAKHKSIANTDDSGSKSSIGLILFRCECNKIYKHKQSLYNHKKKCTFKEKEENIIIEKTELDYKAMFMTMINENQELRKQITELIPRVGNNNNSYNTINNKQRFNINVFLNEQCKDALTMNQFMDQIKVTIDDLMFTKSKGISAGVSNIFIKNMNKLSLYERPIHCTDTKRETVYIKSDGDEGDKNGQWEKDTEKEKLKRAINDITYVQSKNLKLYTDENPDWMDQEDKQDEYMLIVRECLDDINKDNRTEKVVKKMCNMVYINSDEIK